METKKELQLEKFLEGVNSLSNELIDDTKGFLLFAYNEREGRLESSFSTKGRLNCMAECLYSCMKKDPVLANVVIAASNAIVQNRMAEAQMMAEAPTAPEEAAKIPKRRKPKKVIS